MRIGRIALFTLSGMALAGALFAFLPRDAADGRSQEEICYDLEGPVSKIVPACTALIESGRYSGQDLASLYSERAMAYRSWGKIERAIADFNEAARIVPSWADHEWLGDIYEERGELDRALAEYDEMIRLDAEKSSGYQRRADLRMKTGEYEKAVADWTQAIRVAHPDTVVYEYSRRAEAHRRLGHDAERLADLHSAIESYPFAGGAYNDRARYYEEHGERGKAIDDYRRALAVQPYDATATAALKRLGVAP